jgi:hypothetical protein
MSNSQGKKSRFLMLIGVPFLCFSLGFGYFKVAPELVLWLDAQSWQSAQATILSVKLDRAHSREGGTSYEVQARYSYRVNGQPYQSNRVGVYSGKDNIGSYHQDWYQRLQGIQRNQGAVTIWYNPADPSQSLIDKEMRWGFMAFQAVFVLVFFLVGLGMVWAGLSKKPLGKPGHRQFSRDVVVEGIDFSSRQRLHPNVAANVKPLWFFALIWNVIAFPLALVGLDDITKAIEQGEYIALLIFLFPLVGVFLCWMALKSTVLQIKFGQSALRLDPAPGQAGGQVGGDIELSRELAPDTEYQVRLECLHSQERKNSKGHTRIVTSVLWQDAMPGLARIEGGRSIVSFVFDVPKELPQSEPESKNWHHWRLHIGTDIPGIDLALDFDIPVQKGDQSSGVRIPGRERQQQLQRSQQLAECLNAEQQAGALYLSFPYGRELGSSIIWTVFGSVFLAVGVGIGVADMGPGLIEIPVKILFCVVFGGIGLVMLLSAVLTPTTKLDVAIDAASVYVRRFFLGVMVSNKTVPIEDVESMQAKRKSSYSKGGRTINHFQVRLLLKNRQRLTIAESIPGRVLADEAIHFLRNGTSLP